MSFLDVLDSIGTGQRVAAPQTPPTFSPTPEPPHPLSNSTTAKTNFAVSRNSTNGVSLPENGTKRKAGEAFKAVSGRPTRPSPKQGPHSRLQDRSVPTNASSQAASKVLPARVGSPAPLSATTKAPPPGSFAALMAEAKAAQEQKAKSEVGLIKHQATTKVRQSKSERRKQEENERAMKAKLGKQPQYNSKVDKKARLDPKKRAESTYKGTAKPATPMSSYKGTAGLPSQHRPSSADLRHKGGKSSSRYDEYLGTDEEDEGDEDMVDDGYESDASSDMEAGAFDVEEEESRALREARADDAREMALENKLKREKEERRRKLEALARKKR